MNGESKHHMTDQLKNLFEYTKFHIGLYSGLTATCIALLKFGHNPERLGSARYFLFITVVLFVIAGICGGIIASSVCEHASFEEFSKKPLFFWGLDERIPPESRIGKYLRFTYWARAEHTAFWLGVVCAVIGLLVFKG
jgi:hypothetical protein